MSDEAHTAFWDEVAAILVINMEHRVDRWEKLMASLKEIGVSEKVVRINAVDGKNLLGYNQLPWFSSRTSGEVAKLKAGSAGCCLSHRKALEYAAENKLKNYLLLEDDASFDDLLIGRKGELIGGVINRAETWDLFYLGFYQRLNIYHTVLSEQIQGSEFEVRRMRGPLLTHAFLVNSSIYDNMLKELPQEEHIWEWIAYWGSIDCWIYNKFGRSRNVKVWGTMPRLVNQSADFSDIVGRIQTEEESRGEHRKSTLVEKNLLGLNASLNRSLYEIIYQKSKRKGRQLRARLFGFKKT